MQTLLLSEKQNNSFKWVLNPTYYWRSMGASKQLQTSRCVLPMQRATPSGGAVPPQRGTYRLQGLPALSWTCIKVAFVWQRAGHVYPYYAAASGFLAEACKYQKGTICCECRHIPDACMPVSNFKKQDGAPHHLGCYNLRRGPVI